MYDHVGLKVSDLDVSVRFYEETLAPLGYVLDSRDETYAGLGPKGAPALWLYPHKGTPGPGVHIALRAPDHATVQKFHAAAIKAGGRDNGAAGPRPNYGPTYYGAFVIDPDGNNVEAVCSSAT